MGSRGNVGPGFKGDVGICELYGISGGPVSILLVVGKDRRLRWYMTSRSMWSLGSRCSLENLMGGGVWGYGCLWLLVYVESRRCEVM